METVECAPHYLRQPLFLEERRKRVAARHGRADLHHLDRVVGEKVVEHVRTRLAVEGLVSVGTERRKEMRRQDECVCACEKRRSIKNKVKLVCEV